MVKDKTRIRMSILLLTIVALASFGFNNAVAKDAGDFDPAKQILKFNLSTGQYGVEFTTFNPNGARCNYEKGNSKGLAPYGKLVCDIKDAQQRGFYIIVKNKGAGAAKGCKISIAKVGLSKSGNCGGVNLAEDKTWSKDYLFGSWTANFQ